MDCCTSRIRGMNEVASERERRDQNSQLCRTHLLGLEASQIVRRTRLSWLLIDYLELIA